MAEFDYKQRPATPEYRNGWDRLFGRRDAAPSKTFRISPTECNHTDAWWYCRKRCERCGLRPDSAKRAVFNLQAAN